ncbi:MAG: hypothetical protein M3280_01625 [Actinomycetota bacterium]|nr:hypothetical protein [Actinomycetota bacterium]
MAWRPRWRARGTDLIDVSDIFSLADDVIPAPVLGVLAVLVVVIFVLPLFIFIVELLLILLLVIITLVGTTLLRRSWIIEAVPSDRRARIKRWKVTGWRRSNQVMDEIAKSLESGVPFVSPEAIPVTDGQPEVIP